ncbi:RRP15-like protein [Ylistrum balloti]|uniref:RRP15-like protein n=1 Tax=Ylistrum balloti TaxID=509963 RepID=UPI002905EDDD|nr:RRP15-like protein [Ylistrum balloti]
MAAAHVEPSGDLTGNVDFSSDDSDVDDNDIETGSPIQDGDEENVGDSASGNSELSDNDEVSGDDEASGDELPGTSHKAGLANAMAKILGKQLPKHTQVILAKGKTDKEITRKRQEKESEDGREDKKPKLDDESTESLASLEKKRLWEAMGRTKPDPLEREKERALQRIAQRGVVQLFNAVRQQQKILEEKSAGLTEAKKAKVVGNMTKGKFLDILKGTDSNANTQPDTEHATVKIKEEPGEKWSILREDFMMGAKMKDWDKQSSDQDSNNSELTDDSDDG